MAETRVYLDVRVRFRWGGSGWIVFNPTARLAKTWPMGTVVSFRLGSRLRERGVVIGWTGTKVIVGRDGYPWTYHGAPHLLRKVRR